MRPKQVTFVKSATEPVHYPPPDRPDLAVAGRSNVGKSSLINQLCGRKKLARTSGTPGHTRLINFFDVDSRFYLVDLPGYGFAKRPRGEREAWRAMVDRYLNSRESLRAMLVLMDIRRGPEDEEWMLFDALNGLGISPIAVLTKADKLAKNKRRLAYQKIKGQLKGAAASTAIFSSLSGLGHAELWSLIYGALKAER